MAIRYTEKGIGMHDAIIAAGEFLYEDSALGWVCSDEAAVQAIIDNYTLDQAKAEKKAQSLAIAKSLRDKVVAAISPGEMASWTIKRNEALAYSQTRKPEDAPLLYTESLARGISLDEMLLKVMANSNAFSAAEAAISGADGRHRDAIDNLPDFKAVVEYNLKLGWPDF
jgi:hypothetical protein